MQSDVDIPEFVGADYRVGVIDEGKRLRLAGRILLGLSLIATGVFAGYGYLPDNAAMQAIFELVKIGLLPLATLVVSFYFTRADR